MRIITHHSDLPPIAAAISTAPVLGLDIETTSLDPRDGKIRILSLNTESETYVIDLFQTDGLGRVGEALRDYRGVVVGQNLKFEQKWFLHHLGIEIAKPFDTYRASCIIYNGLGYKHDLWSIQKRELGLDPTTEDLGGSNWAGTLTSEQYEYAASDVTHMLRLRDVLRERLRKDGLGDTALVDFSAILPEAAIELTGLYIDQKQWLAVAETQRIKAQTLATQLLTLLPNPSRQPTLFGDNPINLDSNEQVLVSLRKLGIEVEDTRAMTLANIPDPPPVIATLLAYRHASKACTAFGEDYLKHVSKHTGRIHTSYYPYTGAGRYSSQNPNLQQLPRGNEYRGCFRGEGDNKFVVCDYSIIEIRAAAQIARDETLLRLFNEGRDVHKQTAALISNVPYEQVTKAQRQAAKAVNFGLLYSMGPDKLVLYAKATYGVDLSMTEAQRAIDLFFRNYNGLQKWHQRVLASKNTKVPARTLGGRLRYMQPKDHGAWLNTPVQGTCADGLKRALRLVYDRLKGTGAKIVHHVHDEIVVEASDDSCATIVADSMREAMQTYLTDVPIEVSCGVGDSWADK